MEMTAKIISMFPRSVCNPAENTFEVWYAVYPRKCARADAEKAYMQQMLRGHLAPDILRGAINFAEMCRRKGTERDFIPFPATWLRGERWMDEELQDYVPATPEKIAEAMDKADRLMKRGKYAPK